MSLKKGSLHDKAEAAKAKAKEAAKAVKPKEKSLEGETDPKALKKGEALRRK